MAEFSAGRAPPIDPGSLEAERAKLRAPLEYATMLAGPGALLARGARAAILAPGAREFAKQQALANALRNVRKVNKPEEIAERMFMP